MSFSSDFALPFAWSARSLAFSPSFGAAPFISFSAANGIAASAAPASASPAGLLNGPSPLVVFSATFFAPFVTVWMSAAI